MRSWRLTSLNFEQGTIGRTTCIASFYNHLGDVGGWPSSYTFDRGFPVDWSE